MFSPPAQEDSDEDGGNEESDSKYSDLRRGSTSHKVKEEGQTESPSDSEEVFRCTRAKHLLKLTNTSESQEATLFADPL